MHSPKFRFALVPLLFLALIPLSASAGIPLPEVLASRAGKLIFAELLEGSLAANRILGTNVADPATRMARMRQALGDVRMKQVADELNARLDRVYDEFHAQHSLRARDLFAASAAAADMTEAERRLIRKLVTREFDAPFLENLAPRSYRALSENFLRAGAPSRGGTRPPGMSAQERALTFWETRKNAVSTRGNEAIRIEHFEIPLELVDADLAERIAPELRDSLIFAKGGRPHVRWIINPEDTKHFKEVEKFLKNAGADATHYRYFEARRTASRSYVIVDPSADRHVVFSAKVSTNNTGGHWKDKKQPFGDAFEARRAVDLVKSQESVRPYENLVVMDEPAMFGIRAIDQGMLVRSLGDLPGGDVTYLPGFSALHEDLGARIAAANGSKDPAAFWNEHYNKPLARALAELAARTGLTYDSPHSQNFLIEMVGVNPTGRIVLRDFGDTYALAEYFEATGNRKFLERWEARYIHRGSLKASVGVLHGNTMPRWMTNALYERWGNDFYTVWEQEFSALTGLSTTDLGQSPLRRDGRYFHKYYPTRGEAWLNYFRDLTHTAAKPAP